MQSSMSLLESHTLGAVLTCPKWMLLEHSWGHDVLQIGLGDNIKSVFVIFIYVRRQLARNELPDK